MFNNILHLIFYILLFLVFIYLFSYIYHPKSISINQSTLPTFSFNLLYEKQPIVINDLIPNLSQINTLWFKYNTTSLSSTQTSIWTQNHNKYLFIHSSQNQEIHICNPHSDLVNGIPCSNSTILSIELKENQSLILPFKWYYFSDHTNNCLNINDPLTLLLQQLYHE